MKAHQVEALLYEEDLIDLSLPYRYEAIIMPAGSLGLLPKEKADKVLSNFYEHLEEGGQIIIDLEMPQTFQEGEVTRRKILIDENRELLLTSTSDKMDRLAQTTSSTQRYELREKGKIIKRETAHLTLHWYGIAEFEKILSSMGYKKIAYETGYSRQAPTLVTFFAHKLGSSPEFLVTYDRILDKSPCLQSTE